MRGSVPARGLWVDLNPMDPISLLFVALIVICLVAVVLRRLGLVEGLMACVVIVFVWAVLTGPNHPFR